MIATQGSSARDLFARSLETIRRQLRETIQHHPDALPATSQSECGVFPAMLWIVANRRQAEQASDGAWWQDQAVRYTKLLSAAPNATGLKLLFAGRRPAASPDAAPTIESLLDATLAFQSDRDAAEAHCLAARRLLIRGDGSVTTGNPSDTALAVHAFNSAYLNTRDPRFLSTAESCAAYLLENPADSQTAAITASALLQLANLVADPAKSRLYALCANQLLATQLDAPPPAGLGAYFYLDAITRLTDQGLTPLSLGPIAALPPVSALNGNGTEAHEVKPEPQPEPQPQVEPEEPQPKRVRPIAFLLAPFVIFLLIDLLVFRSNYYAKYIEPDSSAGTFEGTFQHELTRPRHPNEVLVLGSSRIAEGFSAKRANLLEPKGGYYFSNGAVAGAGPRCTYYFLRDVDPQRNRYKAVVMTIDDYADPDDWEDVNDRIEDLHSVIARLRLSDVLTFMRSYTTHKAKMEVLRGSLLKSISYQRDLQEFFDHPGDRLEKAELYRGHHADWIYDYGGIEHAITGTTIDWTTNTVNFPPTMPKAEQDELRLRLIINAPQKGHVRAYQVRWMGALADLYRNSKTRIIFIQPPRTPLPRPVALSHWPWTTVDDLAKRPWVSVMPAPTFEDLEKPEFFADYAHLNSEGQKLFSPALAAKVKEILAK